MVWTGSSGTGARACLVCVCGVLALAPRVAHAGNDDEVFLGNQAAMSGGAVTATVSDGAALVYEPSGLVDGADDTVDVSVNALGLRVHRAEPPLAPPTGGGADARYAEFVSIPTTLAYARTVSPRLRVGLGIFATRGSALRVRGALVVEGADEHSDYSLDVAQRGSTIVATAGLGYRVSDVVRVGVSIGAVYDSDDLTQLISASRTDASGLEPTTTDVVSIEEVASYARFGLRATFGVRIVPSARVRLALSLTTPGLAVAGIVSATSSVVAFSTRPVVPVTAQSTTSEDSFAFRAGAFSPFRARFGAAWTIGARGMLSLDGDLQTRIHDERYGVNRIFVINARAGMRFAFSDTLALGAGVFTDRSGSRAPTTGGARAGEDRDFYGATLGVEHVKIRRLAQGEAATALRFVSTYAIRYSFGVGDGSGLVTSASFEATAADALMARTVRIVTHELALYVGSSLRF